MKKFIVYCAMSIAVSGLMQPVNAQQGSVQMHRVQVHNKNSNGWYPARSSNGKFSVLLPFPFNDFTLQGVKGSKVTRAEIVGCASKEGVRVAATRIYYRQKDTAKSLFLKSVHGGVFPGAKHHRMKFKSYDTVEYELGNASTAAIQRYILVKDTLILLSIEWPKKSESAGKSLAHPFLNSLQVDK